MSFRINATVTLPQFPYKIKEKNPSDSKVYPMPGGGQPMIISSGKQARTIELEAYLYSAGLTNAQLLSTYIVPLRNLVHTLIAVDQTPDAVYDGSYFLDSFDAEPITPLVYKITMKLMMGGTNMVFVY